MTRAHAASCRCLQCWCFRHSATEWPVKFASHTGLEPVGLRALCDAVGKPCAVLHQLLASGSFAARVPTRPRQCAVAAGAQQLRCMRPNGCAAALVMTSTATNRTRQQEVFPSRKCILRRRQLLQPRLPALTRFTQKHATTVVIERGSVHRARWCCTARHASPMHGVCVHGSLQALSFRAQLSHASPARSCWVGSQTPKPTIPPSCKFGPTLMDCCPAPLSSLRRQQLNLERYRED